MRAALGDPESAANIRDRLRDPRRGISAGLGRFFRACLRRGLLAPAPPEELVSAFSSLVLGAGFLEPAMLGVPLPEPRKAAALVVRLVVPLPAPPGSLIGVSAGLVEGTARVVLRSDQESWLVPGEILVAPFTDPGWAPYFVADKGLVVDMGGMLSHGSVIAREYGIPAVINVGCGTRRIRTGARLRVDGFRGEVTILSEPGEGADSSSLGAGE